MLSFLTNLFGGLNSASLTKQKAGLYQTSARIAQINARTTRAGANTQAAAIERTADLNQQLAAENLRTARENERAAIGTARAAQARNGFTSEGTGRQGELNAQAALDTEIANMARAASINVLNSYQNAADTRRRGEVSALQHEAQATSYLMQSVAAQAEARAQRNMSIGGAIIGAGSAYLGYGTGKATAAAYNAKNGLTEQDDGYINPYAAGILSADRAASMGYNAAQLLSPWTANAAAAKTDWNSYYTLLTGNTPFTAYATR